MNLVGRFSHWPSAPGPRIKTRLGLSLVLALLVVAPGSALASAPNNESATYDWFLEHPNVAMAPNGDTVAVVGAGTFGVHPKSASGEGEFTHTFAGGGDISGTYTVDGLVDFQPYGCGVVFGETLPDNFCGGRVVFDVTLEVDSVGSVEGQLTIYCLIGKPPASAAEGIRLVIPGHINFNKVVEGENLYVKT